MSNSPAIPESERSQALKGVVRKYVDKVVQLSATNPEAVRQHQHFFFYLTYPWLADSGGDTDAESNLVRLREEIAQLGFDGAEAKQDLERILAEDQHLRECCSTPLNLAYFLDIDFIGYAAFQPKETVITDEQFDNAFSGFSDYIYAEPFKKVAVSHLYNFDAEEDDLRFEGLRIVRLDTATISNILGESGGHTFVHPYGVGNHFIVTEETGPAEDVNGWLYDQKFKATQFASILQYFKDGIVHVDYSVPHFFPLWVNQVRKRGIFFIGEPHRLWYAGGQKFYRLTKQEAEQVNRWWRIYTYPPVAKRLGEERNGLRQAIMRAGDFYESHHGKNDAPSKLIDLAISLEAFFSPSKEGELTHRMAQSASHLIGADADERKQIFSFVKKMYSRRSSLFHGQYDVDAYYDGRFVSDEEVEQLASIIRRSMLRFLVLFIRGTNSRDDILARLVECTLDSEAGEKLRGDSDPDTFIEEYSARLG